MTLKLVGNNIWIDESKPEDLHLKEVWNIHGNSNRFTKKAKLFIPWVLCYLIAVMLMFMLDKYVLQFNKEIWFVDALFVFFTVVGGAITIGKIFLLGKALKLDIIVLCAERNGLTSECHMLRQMIAPCYKPKNKYPGGILSFASVGNASGKGDFTVLIFGDNSADVYGKAKAIHRDLESSGHRLTGKHMLYLKEPDTYQIPSELFCDGDGI